ncbi:unnamed protein product [Parascedosporium putredinis]|uniref:Vps72/YL1 C-terminal domain-containing protein n=1 Tax=Parascedosporium putredinis TaxID=1442378 RepID=A0A9P1H9Q1_9PEZI|nr:unnamed protein product [Parascedosporium putredinis]CAI8000657.1 unnamed protein product [Parascedosporium putredinis]
MLAGFALPPSAMSAEDEQAPPHEATAPREEGSAALSNDSSSDSDSSPSENEASESVEWLATGRAKRSTAGNRMKSMLANEEPDSDLELLFAEDENDAGFEDMGHDSDVHMDSSSDDEDEQNAGEDLEGEKELERQAREKRTAARKRKAQEAIPAKFRKRQTTRMSKEQLHQQMKEREARRLKQLAIMEKKQKKLDAMKKPPMTQEERLAEAASVEKRNAKSLNRWEEAEKQREEERRAKLAALNSRTLNGPVITFWSGRREWNDDRLKQASVGGEARTYRRRAAEAGNGASGHRDAEASDQPVVKCAGGSRASSSGWPIAYDEPFRRIPDSLGPDDEHPRSTKHDSTPIATLSTALHALFSQRAATSTSCARSRFPLQLPGPPAAVKEQPKLTSDSKDSGSDDPNTSAKQAQKQDLSTDASTPKPREGVESPPGDQADGEAQGNGGTTHIATRNSIILQNFNETMIKDKVVQTQILFGRKMSKLQKPPSQPLCAITNLPARYKDPKTGLPFHNAAATRNHPGHGGDDSAERLYCNA